VVVGSIAGPRVARRGFANLEAHDSTSRSSKLDPSFEEAPNMAPTLNPARRHRERCREVRSQMSDYLDGELEPRAAAGVERHVRWCPNCRRMLRNLSRTIAGLSALRDHAIP
jgi:hypothetical protein